MGLIASGVPPAIHVTAGGRHDRQQLAGWSQARLANARVVVVGAGATGNEVIKNLVLIGVGTILVVDFDVVAPSNLARCVFFRDEDVGRPKAEVVACRASELNSAVRVIPIAGDLETDLGEQHMREADAILGCVDNAYARYLINRQARKVGRGWIDTAIAHDAAQVTAFGHAGPCYACGLGERTLHQLRERFSCTGYRRVDRQSPVPTTAVTSSLAGALASEIVVAAIHGLPRTAVRWTLMLGQPRLIVDELSESNDCRFHKGRTPRATTIDTDANATWASVLAAKRWSDEARLLSERDLVSELRCPACDATRETSGLLARIPQEYAVCPRCQTMMEPRIHREVVLGGELDNVSLTELGYSAGSWLRVRIGRSVRTYSLPTVVGWRQEG